MFTHHIYMLSLTKIQGVNYDVKHEKTHDKDKNSIYYPLKKEENIYFEGFWCNRYEDHIPYPKSTSIDIDHEFIMRVTLLIKKYSGPLYLNLLSCRLCNRDLGGEIDCIIRGGNTTFMFPTTILHFYKEHHVLPSEEFYDFVMRIGNLID